MADPSHHVPDSSSTNGHSWPPVRPAPVDPSNYPNGQKSLCGTSIRAFLLGLTLGVTSLLALQLSLANSSLWRPCLFISTLSLFHYLEFDSTARYNTAYANIDSFLLSNNGWQYAVAHTTALSEFFLRQLLLHHFRPVSPASSSSSTTIQFSHLTTTLGILLIATGQPIRTSAMASAGKSFNHIVQHKKQDDHALITTGPYRYFRHPSYAGYYWWALGTQLMLGNTFCFFAYAVVLWKFFSVRIRKEEKSLIQFFGDDYLTFRNRTRVWIPFIP